MTIQEYNAISPTPESEIPLIYARIRSALSISYSIEERRNWISELRQTLIKNDDRWLKAIQKETNKSLFDIYSAEIFATLEHLSYIEKYMIPQLAKTTCPTPLSFLGKRSEIHYRPIGLILIIAPWNYPLFQFIVPLAHALAAGNGVIFKGSEITPLNGILESILNQTSIPKDLIAILYGDKTIGEKAIAARPDKIFFTGSNASGKQVMKAAAEHLIPVELELGGKDPMIICDDVDVLKAAKAATYGAFCNSGQSCTSIERILVHKNIFNEFYDALVAQVDLLKIGYDADGSCDYGPMISKAQIAIIKRHLDDAIAKGAHCYSPAPWDGEDALIPPMIFTHIKKEMDIYAEETFGPCVYLVPFSDEDEAIKLANDSPYGLGASIFCNNLTKAQSIASSLQVGTITINNTMISEANPALPFGGVKGSGFGRIKGEMGLRSFSIPQSIMWERPSQKVEAHWYPYTPEKLQLLKSLTRGLFGRNKIGLFKFLISGLKLEALSQKLSPQSHSLR